MTEVQTQGTEGQIAHFQDTFNRLTTAPEIFDGEKRYVPGKQQNVKELTQNLVYTDPAGNEHNIAGIINQKYLSDKTGQEKLKTAEQLLTDLKQNPAETSRRLRKELGLPPQISLPQLHAALQIAGVDALREEYLSTVKKEVGQTRYSFTPQKEAERRKIYAEIDTTSQKDAIILEGGLEKALGREGFAVLKNTEGKMIAGPGYAEFLQETIGTLRSDPSKLKEQFQKINIELDDGQCQLLSQAWQAIESHQRSDGLQLTEPVKEANLRRFLPEIIGKDRINEVFQRHGFRETVMEDLRFAQALLNVGTPAEKLVELARLEHQLGQEQNQVKKEEILAQLNLERKKIYQAFLIAYHVKPNGQEIPLKQEKKSEIEQLALQIKQRLTTVSKDGKTLNEMSISEANRLSLAEQLRSLGVAGEIDEDRWNKAKQENVADVKIKNVVKGFLAGLDLSSVNETDIPIIEEIVKGRLLTDFSIDKRIAPKYGLDPQKLTLGGSASLAMGLKGMELLSRRLSEVKKQEEKIEVPETELPDWLEEVNITTLKLEQKEREIPPELLETLRRLSQPELPAQGIDRDLSNLDTMIESEETDVEPTTISTTPSIPKPKVAEGIPSETIIHELDEQIQSEDIDVVPVPISTLPRVLEPTPKEKPPIDVEKLQAEIAEREQKIQELQQELLSRKETTQLRKEIEELQSAGQSLVEEIYQRGLGRESLEQVADLTKRDTSSQLIFKNKEGQTVNLLDSQAGLLDKLFPGTEMDKEGKPIQRRLFREALLFSPKLAGELAQELEHLKPLQDKLEEDTRRRRQISGLKGRVTSLEKQLPPEPLVVEKEVPVTTVLPAVESPEAAVQRMLQESAAAHALPTDRLPPEVLDKLVAELLKRREGTLPSQEEVTQVVLALPKPTPESEAELMRKAIENAQRIELEINQRDLERQQAEARLTVPQPPTPPPTSESAPPPTREQLAEADREADAIILEKLKALKIETEEGKTPSQQLVKNSRLHESSCIILVNGLIARRLVKQVGDIIDQEVKTKTDTEFLSKHGLGTVAPADGDWLNYLEEHKPDLVNEYQQLLQDNTKEIGSERGELIFQDLLKQGDNQLIYKALQAKLQEAFAETEQRITPPTLEQKLKGALDTVHQNLEELSIRGEKIGIDFVAKAEQIAEKVSRVPVIRHWADAQVELAKFVTAVYKRDEQGDLLPVQKRLGLMVDYWLASNVEQAETVADAAVLLVPIAGPEALKLGTAANIVSSALAELSQEDGAEKFCQHVSSALRSASAMVPEDHPAKGHFEKLNAAVSIILDDKTLRDDLVKRITRSDPWRAIQEKIKAAISEGKLDDIAQQAVQEAAASLRLGETPIRPISAMSLDELRAETDRLRKKYGDVPLFLIQDEVDRLRAQALEKSLREREQQAQATTVQDLPGFLKDYPRTQTRPAPSTPPPSASDGEPIADADEAQSQMAPPPKRPSRFSRAGVKQAATGLGQKAKNQEG